LIYKMTQEYTLKTENRKIDITDIEFEKGDKLIIDGIEQLIIDICEASVFTQSNGIEKEYFIDIDQEKNKFYLVEGR
tara:strand:- start:8062 stop:8292 length:231 start_codon:yes stop_codon:yes gene_type:complete